ncbi:uncharacterized protein LOC62_07G009512 [Vanrija pseudolonga]|uniref:Uncharacterized protein n=1 Tax=Vanrija pseudolonga TaxID=143232 RepID=A0AAF1BRM1_9TREE|nr:hypothetical protein LOC62_07G009512 [Vanrija pseudolonga]
MPRRRQPSPPPLPSSSPSSSRSPSPPPTPSGPSTALDAQGFPHIWAGVLAAVASADLQPLRAVSRSLRTQIDSTLARHVLVFEAHNAGVVHGNLGTMLAARAAAKAREAERIATGKEDEGRSHPRGRRARRAERRIARGAQPGQPPTGDSSSDSDSAEDGRDTRSLTEDDIAQLRRFGFSKPKRAATEAYRAHQVQVYTVLPSPSAPAQDHIRGASGVRYAAQHHRYLRSLALERNPTPQELMPFYAAPEDGVLSNTRVLDVLGCPPLPHLANLLPHLEIVRLIPHPDWEDYLLRRPTVGRYRDSLDELMAEKLKALRADTVVLFSRAQPPDAFGSAPIADMHARRLVVVVPPFRNVLTPNGYAVPAYTGPRYDLFEPSRCNDYALWKHGPSECAAEEIVYIFTGVWPDVELRLGQDDRRSNGFLGLLHACFHEAHVSPKQQPHILVGVEAIPAQLLRLDAEYEALRTTNVEGYYAALMDIVVQQYGTNPDLCVDQTFEELPREEQAEIVRSLFTFMTHDAYRDLVGEQTYIDYTAAYDWM